MVCSWCFPHRPREGLAQAAGGEPTPRATPLRLQMAGRGEGFRPGQQRAPRFIEIGFLASVADYLTENRGTCGSNCSIVLEMTTCVYQSLRASSVMLGNFKRIKSPFMICKIERGASRFIVLTTWLKDLPPKVTILCLSKMRFLQFEKSSGQNSWASIFWTE